MGEEQNELIAQLQHNCSKLQDELDLLKEHTFSLEESLNTKCSELSMAKKHIKSLEQQNDSVCQILKEKEHFIDLIEQDKANYKRLNDGLSSENSFLKQELFQEKLKNKQIETIKTERDELKNAFTKIKEEKQILASQLSLKTEECFSSDATVNDLMLQVKELKNEKAELLAMRNYLLQEKENRVNSSENLECYLRKSSHWSISVLDLQDLDSSSNSRELMNSNLRDELLEVELREKKILIGQLTTLIREKEEEESERKKSVADLKKALKNAGLLDCGLKVDLRLDSSAFYNIYEHLLRIINWPEGQSTECKPLTDAPALSLIVKDGVQTAQPSSVRTIETISIASQTEPLKNLSPVLPFRSYEKLQSNRSSNQLRSDSDEEEDVPLSFIEKDKAEKGFQLFFEPKNCNLDMDMYRSCRKLSVLPEEDIDESFHRKSSFKKPCRANLNTFNLKTHSADDITHIQSITTLKPLLKASSCLTVSPKNLKQSNGVAQFSGKCGSCEVYFEKATDENLKVSANIDNNELEFAIKSQKDDFRQPHSFDSYLDPLISRNSPLPRQTSDPTQNTVFASSVTRRGSYIRRPRSTCRPLTLPCDKSEKKKEERICKVRFDLGGISPKNDENLVEKELKLSPVLNTAKKIKMVSRFRVEVVDEDEFRKSLEENERNTTVTRKRPPLIHSVVYKKSALRDLTNFDDKKKMNDDSITPEVNNFPTESPDSPLYDTATENSPADSFDGSENYINDSYPAKRRKQSDASCYSFEDSQSSSEGNDILVKSIKLHTSSKCLIMKELKKENSDSSCSNADSEIPYIDAEDLPVIKANPEGIKIPAVSDITFSEKSGIPSLSPGSVSEGSDVYLTPCDVTPVSESNDASTFGLPKSSGLSKSPTVLKNLSNFELLAAISESRKLSQNEAIEEEKEEQEEEEEEEQDVEGKKNVEELKSGSDSLKRTSSDMSEASESDTLTYGTVKSHVAVSSDCDSETYVTVWSDKSFTLERKFSDLSENSSSPYNTPPDTSSASFCTPPDTYSPILNSIKKYSSVNLEKCQRSSDGNHGEKKREEFSDNLYVPFDISSSSPPVQHQNTYETESKACFGDSESERLNPGKLKSNVNYCVIFDSPKLEFYETNDSVENLEAFLQTEEGLADTETKTEVQNERPDELENLPDPMFFESEDFREALSQRNSLESPKLLERRKKHPPLSRQNSTEEYNFLDPHDSCLNLSEEVSSPSTTPDTSNKTVIFKNVPLTVSNTIDLDDDFPISETEIQVNFNGSQTEILEVSQKGEPILRYTKDGHCLSEPCTPSISSADFLEFCVPRKQRSSFTEESLMCGKFESNLPEIIVSRLSSESENSDSEVAGVPETDFASNVSDRSEIHLSDVNSLSGHSDNCGSLSEHSDNVVSDVFSSDSDRSSGISPEVTQISSSSPASDRMPPVENSLQNREQEELPTDDASVLCSDFCTSGETGLVVEGPSGQSRKMSKRSNSPVSDRNGDSSLDLSDASSASDMNSDNSRDVNLNSKKFTDCNLFGREIENYNSDNNKNNNINNNNNYNKSEEQDLNFTSAIENLSSKYNLRSGDKDKREVPFGKPGLNQGSDSELENSNLLLEAKKTLTTSSTPKPESADSQSFYNLFTISTDTSPAESGGEGQTYLVAKTAVNQSAALTNEEVGKTFQDLSFAFKIDSTTIQRRLELLKRKRDQAESNIENELGIIKAKLETLQYIGLNSECVNLMTDLKKQLNFVRNATVQLSSSAEGYGYTQHEERLLELIAVTLQHVENIESSKADSSKMSDKLRTESQSSRDDDKILRRRSVAAMALPGNSRRRASIATLPRMGNSIESGSNGKVPQWNTPSRSSGCAAKKLSFSQASPRSHFGNLTGTEDLRRDSISIRHRKESRANEVSMANIDESAEQRSSSEADSLKEPIDVDNNTEVNDSSLHLKQLFESIEEVRRNSNAQEHITAAHCLRRIIEWNKLLISSARFRWPENVLQYAPFYITWYIVFVFALVFIGGLFTGINGCYAYSCAKYSALWFGAPVVFTLARRYYRCFLPLFLTLVFALILFFFWLTKFLLPQLTNEEVDSLFRAFGLEIRYLYGPPPI